MSETVVFSRLLLIELCITKSIVFSFQTISLVFVAFHLCALYMRSYFRLSICVYQPQGLLVDFKLDPQNAFSSELYAYASLKYLHFVSVQHVFQNDQIKRERLMKDMSKSIADYGKCLMREGTSILEGILRMFPLPILERAPERGLVSSC